MVDISSTCTIKEDTVGSKKFIYVETPATADDGDTIALTLEKYGAKTIEGIIGWTHSTTDSIVITEAPTTAVVTGVLTITIGGATDDKKRVFWVVCNSQ
jgi:hypothetical protein